LLGRQINPFFNRKIYNDAKFDIHNNQYLEINLELQKRRLADEALERLALSVLRDALISKSSEFAEISRSKNSVHLLKIIFWHYGHPNISSPVSSKDGSKRKIEMNICLKFTTLVLRY